MDQNSHHSQLRSVLYEDEVDLERLDALLASPENTDHDINWALHLVSLRSNGHQPPSDYLIAACRVICNRFSPTLKALYLQEQRDSNPPAYSYEYPLRHAAEHASPEIVKILLPYFNVNQMVGDATPLVWAAQARDFSLEMCQLLVQNGAIVNIGGQYGPVYMAVEADNIDTVRYLLEDVHADPNLGRLPVNEENDDHDDRCTDIAIRNGKPEMLRLLLHHNAFVGGLRELDYERSLTYLLTDSSPEPRRETKIEIVRILVEHAETDEDTAEYLIDSFKDVIGYHWRPPRGHEILFEGGMRPSSRAFYIAIDVHYMPAIQTLIRHGGNPFLQEEGADERDNGDDQDSDEGGEEEEDDDDDEESDEGDDDDDEQSAAAPSPFHAAARINNKDKAAAILRLFMSSWNERFAASGGSGRDTNGDYPIHLLCRGDAHISVHAIELLVTEFNANVSQPNSHGLLPFHLAVMSNASLDVIFYLLNHYPDALLPQEHRQLSTTRPAVVAATTDGSQKEQEEEYVIVSDAHPSKKPRSSSSH